MSTNKFIISVLRAFSQAWIVRVCETIESVYTDHKSWSQYLK